jgi:hypothetical protein
MLPQIEDIKQSQLDGAPLPHKQIVHEDINEHFPGLWTGKR